MYLVHLSLEPPPHSDGLPSDVAQLLRASATAADGLEHISVHASAWPHPVIGFFLRAPSLGAAEATAAHIWKRAIDHQLPLSTWTLKRAVVPLLPVELDWFAPGQDPGQDPGHDLAD